MKHCMMMLLVAGEYWITLGSNVFHFQPIPKRNKCYFNEHPSKNISFEWFYLTKLHSFLCHDLGAAYIDSDYILKMHPILWTTTHFNFTVEHNFHFYIIKDGINSMLKFWGFHVVTAIPYESKQNYKLGFIFDLNSI